jgi:predicted ArsR family transcriptional regulator
VHRLERLINLVAALLQAERPLTAEELRNRLPGYAEDHGAFRRAFERDKEALRDLGEQVAEVARLRDQAGYQAEWSAGAGDTLVLTENNCAIHRVAEHHPGVCTMELALLREVLGPGVEVTRVAHAMAGDPVCSYCIRPRTTVDPE